MGVIQLKRSTTAASVPTAGQLAPGELALNLADKILYFEDDLGGVQSFSLSVSDTQAALDDKLNSSAYTAADVLTKIKTVDGAGSGLDADLLDGAQGSTFAKLASANFTTLQVGGNTVWHAGNHGAASGLDADLLDGQQGSAYALKSGATFTGTVDAALLQQSGNNVWHAGNLNPALFAYLTGADFDGLTVGGEGVYHTGNLDLTPYALLTGATFSGGVSILEASPSFFVGTTANSGEQADLTFRGARTSLTATIAQINFDNNLSGGVNTAAQWLIAGDGDVNLSVGTLKVAGGTVWHANNDGVGSGLDADLLDGLQGTSYVRSNAAATQSIAVGAGDFIVTQTQGGVTNVVWWDGSASKLYLGTGGGGGGVIEPRTNVVGTTDLTMANIEATGGFTGNGGALTGVDAANLGGQSPASYALLSGATFTGNLTGANIASNGTLSAAGNTTLQGLGVGGASPDGTNKFAFYGTNLLLNSGGSIDMKYNKNATGNDASMTFQSAFSTKALVGLLGDDDFTIKVGGSFTTAMKIAEATGLVEHPAGARTKRKADVAGRWYCYTDNRWICNNTNYGIATENHNTTGGTGTEPNVLWHGIGIYMRAGETIKDVIMSMRCNSSEVTAFHWRIFFQHATGTATYEDDPANPWSATGETNRITVHTSQDNAMGVGWHRKELADLDYTALEDGHLIMALQPVGTLTATRYIYTSGVFEILTEG